MPTTLLLDGPDLEALLVRARQEGGPNARITRAEKVRRGGVAGFFTREVFEVAVEVPDGYVPEPRQVLDAARPAVTAGAGAVGAGAVGASAVGAGAVGAGAVGAGAVGAGAVGAGAAAGTSAGTAAGAAADADPFDAVVKAIAAMGAASSADAGPAPDLGALNAAGVTSNATRVRSAQRTATARAYAAGDSLTTPGLSAATPSAATALLDRLEGRDAHAGREAVDGAHDLVPHEAALDPASPSTQQPAFSALLDQLRRETLDPSATPPAARAQEADAAAAGTPSPAFAPLIPAQAQASPGLDARTPEPATEATTEATAETPAEAPSDEAGAARTAQPAPTDPTTPTALSVPLALSAPTGQPVPSAARPRSRRPVDPQLKADRQLLRALGVPATLTRKLRSGDRFTAVRRLLAGLPTLDVDVEAPVVAVVGPEGLATLEGHRVAVDLAVGSAPRPVLTLPASGAQRETVLESSHRLDHAVIVVPDGGAEDAGTSDRVRVDLRAVRAQVVVAVLDARRPLQQNQAWLRSLGRVDALALEHAGDVADPARVLELGIPVVRVDGVGMDALGWTAMLCARLADADASTADASTADASAAGASTSRTVAEEA